MIHPTQKPVELLEWLIKTYTNEGETVLDNCMGSGSTGVACVNTNRKFIGIELDNTYFEIAKNRIQEAKQERIKRMRTYKITERPLAEERELHISLTLNDNDEWVWEVDTNISKYINALKKRGWEQTSEGVLAADGTVQSATFRSTDKKPISFRDLSKVRDKRVLSDEHIAKLRAGLQKNKASDE